MSLSSVLQLCAVLTAVHSAAVTKSAPPNILFIVADDLGWNDVSYHGSEVQTPNIDFFANNGVKLENYYVQPACTPSRSALLTGRYPIHTGLQHEVIYAGQRAGLPLSLNTLADELKERGYDTHGIGKWHLGFYKEEYLPVQRGFDTWKGYLTGNEDYYTHMSCESLGCGYDFRDNNSLDYKDNNTYSTLTFTKHAKEIIGNHDVSKPLFLYMPYQAVHFPMQVPISYLKQYDYIDDKNRRIFAGMASCLDESIGNVTGYLKDKGMWDNTIMVFTTDNGGETSRGGNNWPLRGKKWTLWEGGIRGAAFVHSPLLGLSSGRTHRSLMHISDWYPTIIEGILKDPLPSALSLDGVDMWDSISRDVPGRRTEILHNIDPLSPHPGDAVYNDTFPTNTTAAIRVGDWKLLTGYPGVSDWFPPFVEASQRHADWFLHFLERREYELLVSPERLVKKAMLRYDTSFHTAYDDPRLETLGRYDPTKWLDESKLNIQRTSTGAKKNLWLFNITADPEEIIDLSAMYPEVVRQLLAKLAYYNSTAVAPNFPDIDPQAAPAKHNGSWTPWVANKQNEEPLVSKLANKMSNFLSRAGSYLYSLW